MAQQSERTLLHHGKKFDLEMVRFTSASGRTIQREVVRHGGAVCILPILQSTSDPAPRIVMIRVHRFTLARDLWELPAGTIEPAEPPHACAARELIEETGYRADSITSLGSFYTTPGMTDERMHAFAATGLTHVGQRLEEDEQIQPKLLTTAEALALLDSGELMDAKSIVTLTLALRKGLIAP